MTEETAAAAEAPAQSSEQKFAIQRVFLKDLSFETPQARLPLISSGNLKSTKT